MPIRIAKARESKINVSQDIKEPKPEGLNQFPWRSLLLILLFIYSLGIVIEKYHEAMEKSSQKEERWSGCLDNTILKTCKPKRKY